MGVLASFGYVKYGDSVQQIIGRLVGRVACVLSLHHWNFHDQLLRTSKYCADMHATCDTVCSYYHESSWPLLLCISAQNLPVDQVIVVIINITLIIGVALTYPLQIFPVVQILENMTFAEGTLTLNLCTCSISVIRTLIFRFPLWKQLELNIVVCRKMLWSNKKAWAAGRWFRHGIWPFKPDWCSWWATTSCTYCFIHSRIGAQLL